jgi:hypothetical protein
MTTNPLNAYTYSILRYVHDIATGEFVNVGVVIIGNDSAFVGSRFKIAYGRVRKAFPNVDPEAFRSRMKGIQAAFDRVTQRDIAGTAVDVTNASARGNSAATAIEQLVYTVIRKDDSSFQWSTPGGGLTKDFEETLDSLYRRFVTKYDSEGAGNQRKDEDIWKHFRTELERRNVLAHLQEKVIAVADDSVKFDHAWKNGTWHCYEPVSFDLASDASIREKAHRLLGQVQSIKDAEESFNVYFLVGKPTDAERTTAYEKAVSILRKSPLSSVVEEAQAAEFSEAVANAIGSHDARPLGDASTPV